MALHFGICCLLVQTMGITVDLTLAPLRNEEGQIIYFFGAQVDVSTLFHKHNDLSAVLSRHFALNDAPPISPRKSFFRRLSERTRIRPLDPLSPPTMGLEEDIVRPNYRIGQQISSFRTAYSKVIQGATGLLTESIL
jgi:hypothetical protein